MATAVLRTAATSYFIFIHLRYIPKVWLYRIQCKAVATQQTLPALHCPPYAAASDSIYGAPFKDEFHSRLRFSHRGLLACANRNEPHTNGSQFFITLDK
jgi:cyclophilin family peptidyl-prolyl cis-trans isomerase